MRWGHLERKYVSCRTFHWPWPPNIWNIARSIYDSFYNRLNITIFSDENEGLLYMHMCIFTIYQKFLAKSAFAYWNNFQLFCWRIRSATERKYRGMSQFSVCLLYSEWAGVAALAVADESFLWHIFTKRIDQIGHEFWKAVHLTNLFILCSMFVCTI